jgi:hypothetical protein
MPRLAEITTELDAVAAKSRRTLRRATLVRKGLKKEDRTDATRIASLGRFWQARHPPYAAFNQTSSSRFTHS